MALDLYFKDDVAQRIVSIAVAMLSAAVANGGANVEYCRGVIDTSRAQALNYGLAWGALSGAIWSALGDDRSELGRLLHGRENDYCTRPAAGAPILNA